MDKLQKMMVMYGGSFNPILYSHLSFAEQVINEFEQVEKVIFVPVNSKYQKADLASNEHRYKMVEKAIRGNGHFLLSDIEVKSKESLYTIQTLEELQKQYKDYKIGVMMGTDNLLEIETWKTPEKILENFKIIVRERGEHNLEQIIQNSELLRKYTNSILKLKDTSRSNMSSTLVRNKIRSGQSIRYLLPQEVEEYIKENNVY